MNSKDKGIIGEHFFMFLCSQNNIIVLEPRGDNQPFDFVIYHKGNFIKVQVKSSTFNKKGATIFSITKSVGGKEEASYTKEDCDYFFFYDINRNDYAFIPIEELPKGGKFQLRFEQALIKQPTIKYFKDYKLDKFL